jgi:hypothetical protein
VWEVEFTDEFGLWWDTLEADEQDSITQVVGLLENLGPMLPRPYADTVNGSRHRNMKELRVQHEGRPFRILFAFDPRRCAVLLVGGDKTGNARWYEQFIPIADDLFDKHLNAIGRK